MNARPPGSPLPRAAKLMPPLLLALAAGCGGGELDDPADAGSGADASTAADAQVQLDAGGPTDAGPVSFSRDVLPIFRRSCANGYCHPGGYSPMSLMAAEAHAALVGAASVGCGNGRLRVKAGAATASESDLIAKLTGTELCGNTGSMPPSGPLPAEEIERVRAWIAAGAQND
jgi:hypothetical protein